MTRGRIPEQVRICSPRRKRIIDFDDQAVNVSSNGKGGYDDSIELMYTVGRMGGGTKKRTEWSCGGRWRDHGNRIVACYKKII